MNANRPNVDLGKYWHEHSKDASMGGRMYVPIDIEKWPDEWNKISYKEYKNSRIVNLSHRKSGELNKNIFEILEKRHSAEHFKKNKKITLENLSDLICWSISKNDDNFRRKYPSGGGRYPLEFYLYVHRVEGLEQGVYHYNVRRNVLEYLKPEDLKNNFPNLCGHTIFFEAGITFFITAVQQRNKMKYGERGTRYILLEVGHAAQNILLVATALGFDVRPIAGVSDKLVEKVLNIDGEHEVFLYTVCIG